MKRMVFAALILAVSALAVAQDTLRYGNPWYMFNAGFPNNYSVGYRFPGSHQVYSWGIFDKVAIQPYVAPSVSETGPEGRMIYGVALTTHREMPLDTPWWSVGVYELQSSYYNGHSAIVGSFRAVETAWMDATIRHCRFGYVLGSNGAMSHCYEYYFDRPVSVHDTFYVGFVTQLDYSQSLPENYFTPTCGVDETGSQTWWRGGDISAMNRSRYAEYYGMEWWGALFPIVGIRCTAPRGGEAVRVTGDTVVVRFAGDGEEHEYEVAYAREGYGVDTTAGVSTAGGDSVFVFTGIEPGYRYWYRVRRSCRVGNTVVWSPWSVGYSLPRSVGLEEAGGEMDVEVSPNPAGDYAEVIVSEEGVELELYDAQGRLLQRRRVEGSKMRMDLRGLPSGVYSLRLSGPSGSAIRRLVVGR